MEHKWLVIPGTYDLISGKQDCQCQNCGEKCVITYELPDGFDFYEVQFSYSKKGKCSGKKS